MHVLLKCDNCGGDAWKKRANLKRYPSTFCCRDCEREWKRSGQFFDCANQACGEKVWRTVSQQRRSKSGKYFCSRSCATVVNNGKYKTGERHGNWNGGDSTYRERAIRHYGAKCSNLECDLALAGVDIPEGMLDVHHLNNRSDNLIENLEVLCVWCHARTTRNI